MNENDFSLTLRTYVMKLCRNTYKTYSTDTRRENAPQKMLPYFSLAQYHFSQY